MISKKYKKIFIHSFLIFYFFVFVFGVIRLIQNVYYENKLENTQKIILEQANSIDVRNDLNTSSIDFANLREVNEDIIGWITIPNTHINYAIVQGSDNSFYLDHDVLKNYNIYGSIFMNFENSSDFSDANTILFGHNTYKDSMFSDIVRIYHGEYGSDITILIHTEEGTYEYQVYSSYITIDTDSEPLNLSRSYFEKTEVSFPLVSRITKTLTISTCYEDDERRVILHAIQK